ncbi:MAG: alanine--tRNA ligase [Firmicutes bacterium]|jgi:alanyl-tRNA synthetase|nr:alanine--tRNA ligase [Bacillota bacterium]
MQSHEIRSLFLNFFARKDHLVVPSYSLVPQDDPSLLLVGAGMAPLKPYFTGEKAPPHPRMATCQKCVRTPDIELVGITGRHATFFEMLGNFSFGDYFKEKAILWAWEFVTHLLKLPTDKLWISVYEEDEEAADIWRKEVGLDPARIVRMGKEDNFWEIGTGPCGPSSEIYFDLGAGVGCGRPDCKVGCDCDRFLEVWNLVFTQYNRMPDGSLLTLDRKNIDTGAGLERLATVLQGVTSIYEIDTVRPLVEYIAGEAFSVNNRLSLRIVAEHLRGVVFLVADGVLPSNEGRGYVLRRLLRRAVRHGRLVGIDNPFLHRAVSLVVSLMKSTYPELGEREDYIKQVVKLEENRFRETLNQGMDMLESYLVNEFGTGEQRKDRLFPGEVAFRLYDTYGFPLDLTREILAEKGLEVDVVNFDRALQEQRSRGRKARKSGGDGRDPVDDLCWEESRHLSTHFEGYERLEAEARIMAICRESLSVEEVSEGDTVEIIIDRTPFYAQSGGQVADTGVITGDGVEISITDVYFNIHEQIVHRGKVDSGMLKKGATVRGLVDNARRQAIMRSHTSTHLLHRALKEFLGEHVNQAGSQVIPDRIRFDFTHFAALTDLEMRDIESKINAVIREGLPVSCKYVTLEEARKHGAMALFEEKYGDEVRVVNIGTYSSELCGGTHLENTGQIGLLRIVKEESIGAGIRRIEALTGEEALKYDQEQDNRLKRVAGILKTTPDQIEERINDWVEENRRLQHDFRELERKMIFHQAADLLRNSLKQNGNIQIITDKVDVNSMETLREVADHVKERLSRGVVVLGAIREGRVLLVAAVTPELIEEGIHAGKIIAIVARKVGGGGGGRPDLAQAGGKDPAALPDALDMVSGIVEEQRGNRR